MNDVKIRMEGAHDLRFSYGWSCGKSVKSVGVSRVGLYGGGVMLNKEIKRLRDFLNRVLNHPNPKE